MRSVFVNPERCIGCRQCEIACATEHSLSKDEAFAFLERPVPRARVHVEAGLIPSTAFPNRCRHCNPAPCLNVCPTGAISRVDEFGLVIVEPKRCIGCAMCAVVCPFDVITFYPLAEGLDPSVAVSVKCDGCIDRLRKGAAPACTEACKVDALIFGELNDVLRAGRLRLSGEILAAVGGTVQPASDPLGPWRSAGKALVAVVQAAEQSSRSALNSVRTEERPERSQTNEEVLV